MLTRVDLVEYPFYYDDCNANNSDLVPILIYDDTSFSRRSIDTQEHWPLTFLLTAVQKHRIF